MLDSNDWTSSPECDAIKKDCGLLYTILCNPQHHSLSKHVHLDRSGLGTAPPAGPEPRNSGQQRWQLSFQRRSWLIADRKPLPHLLPILILPKRPSKTYRRRAKNRSPIARHPRKSTPFPPSINNNLPPKKTNPTIWPHKTARIPHLPTLPPPRLRIHPHRLRPQTNQPRPPPRNPPRPPPRARPPPLHPHRRPRPRKPPQYRPQRHQRLPLQQPKPRRRRSRLHAGRAGQDRQQSWGGG